VRGLYRHILQDLGFLCLEAGEGETALALAEDHSFDLVLLDLHLPGMDGYEVCRQLRQRSGSSNLKIIVVSGAATPDDLADALPHGADDYLHKPFHPRQLRAKAEHALRLKDVQERAGVLVEQLQCGNQQLQRSLEAREGDLRQAHNALLFGMAKMAELRDGETSGHLRRLQEYTRVLAKQAAAAPPWSGLVEERFLAQLERCVALHDIGKIGLPEDVLLKPGALSQQERSLVETHPLIGDRILEALAREHGDSLEFLGMARGIVRHHHERYDGKGYPDHLAGDAIPAAARLVAVADVYDALRRQRFHKPAMSHARAIRVLQERSPGQFDPTLLRALASCHERWEQIYEELQD
jgi:putative two-component system response regulator